MLATVMAAAAEMIATQIFSLMTMILPEVVRLFPIASAIDVENRQNVIHLKVLSVPSCVSR